MRGQNLRLFLADSCVAASTSLTFHVGASTEDVSTKDSTGDWVESAVTNIGWDAQVDALVVAAEVQALAPPQVIDEDELGGVVRDDDDNTSTTPNNNSSSTSNTSSAQTLDTLMGYLENETLLTAKFRVTTGTQNREASGSALATGSCYVTDISVSAANKKQATYNVKLQGVGALSFS